jgi:hypothetical protein
MKYTVPDLRPLQQKVSLPADITPGTSPINREAVSRT